MEPKYSEDYYVRILLQKTKIKEMMNTPVISLFVNSPFSKVVELFNEKKIRHLPIVNKSQKVIGLMTQRHLYKIHSPRKLIGGEWFYDKEALNNIDLQTVMIKKPFTLHPENSIADALDPMVRHKYGCIPIVDNKNILCGIITQYDILKTALNIIES